jgi:hypothetical protein
MGIFDRAKAAIDAAKEKVGEVTGVDNEKLIEAAKSVTDAASSLGDAATAVEEGRRE